MPRWTVLAPLMLVGCIDGVTQVAGTGALYTTKCSAEMEVRGVEYFARCTPQSCADGFDSEAVNHVVVALDPGRRIVGYAERVCVQDLADATGLFGPSSQPPPQVTQESPPSEE